VDIKNYLLKFSPTYKYAHIYRVDNFLYIYNLSSNTIDRDSVL
jgi:hypothetical protein